MSRTVFDRLGVKTPDHRFRHELEAGFEMPPRVAQSVLELAKNVFNPDGLYGDKGGRLRPGQIRHIIAAAAAPRGRPLRETEMMEVVWTIDAGEEDLEVLQVQGSVALRRMRILRLVNEALDQGGEPTQEDLGKALSVTARTIRSDIAALEAEGYRVATRGKLRGVGRGQTHKVPIVELYLKRQTLSDVGAYSVIDYPICHREQKTPRRTLLKAGGEMLIGDLWYSWSHPMRNSALSGSQKDEGPHHSTIEAWCSVIHTSWTQQYGPCPSPSPEL